MKPQKTRGAAITAYCRECIADDSAKGTWREQVAACGCTDCPLWRYRPLPRKPPAWIASRNSCDLPGGFGCLPHDEAIATLRGNIAAGVDSAGVFHAPLTAQGPTGTTPRQKYEGSQMHPYGCIGK